jgi:hypothetical protein
MIRDILTAMVESQRLVQREYGHDFDAMTDVERMAYLTTMTTACSGELHEALAETGWKPWASSNHINREEWMGEMADAWLFFMNLMLAGGMTGEDLIERTAKKQDNSYKRIKEGYDGVSTKCPVCRRAYDNDGVKCKPDTCAYIPSPGQQTGIITESAYPANICPGCGNPYDSADAAQCFPQGQGFGWCSVKSLTVGLQIVELGA